MDDNFKPPFPYPDPEPHHLQVENEELRAKNERLRAKLQEVRDNCPPDTHGHNGKYFDMIREIVDEALKQIGPSCPG